MKNDSNAIDHRQKKGTQNNSKTIALDLDYLSIHRQELVKMVLQNNPQKRTVKQVALHFHKSEDAIRKWSHPLHNDGTRIELEELSELYRFTHDERIKRWVRAQFYI